MFIQIETTPDPAKLTFLPGCEVLPQGTVDLHDKTQAATSPLAERIFAISGVSSVSFAKDSITIAKDSGDWQLLKPVILGAIMEHFRSGAPVLRPEATAVTPSSSPSGSPTDMADVIREALKQVIDPEIGYNIVDIGLVYDVAVEEGGVVRITMTTTTVGCPATDYLKSGAGEAAASVPGVEFVDVKLTYDPRWTPDMMTPSAKAYLGIA